MKTPIADLTDRLGMLGIRYAVAFSTAAAPPEPHVMYTTAESIVAGLSRGDADAVARARAIVDPTELFDADFWGTPLGRLMFAAGAHGSDDALIGQAFAARVLDVSRQWVGTLIAQGRLTRVGHRLVPVGEVRGLLVERMRGRN